jgi:hypothetical protein
MTFIWQPKVTSKTTARLGPKNKNKNNVLYRVMHVKSKNLPESWHIPYDSESSHFVGFHLKSGAGEFPDPTADTQNLSA